MPRFMLLQNYGQVASGAPVIWEWKPEDMKAHIDFQIALNAELQELGEFVDAQGLAGPEAAKFVVSDGTSAPVVTDGPYPESKELLAGYRIIDVESLERAIEIAARASAAPGPDGAPIQRLHRGAGDHGRARPRGDLIAPSTEDLLRELAPQVLGAVARRYRNFADAEDAVQAALLEAATHVARARRARRSTAWLVRVASRRMADQFRSDEARRRREMLAASWSSASPDSTSGNDDSLILVFMCCHPALTPASAIPLTLRAVGGLTTREIATAFLVPEATMAQRISRAKSTIRASDEPFALPPPAEIAPNECVRCSTCCTCSSTRGTRAAAVLTSRASTSRPRPFASRASCTPGSPTIPKSPGCSR